jgi:putative redox protein
MTIIDTVYQGELRCQASHGPSGTQLETDAPTDNQGQGERFSPTDLVATALSSCMLTIMGIVAKRHGWELEGCSARVEKTMSSDSPRRIAKLTVWVTWPPQLDGHQRTLLQRAAEQCPVKLSLDGAIAMELHWSE